MIDIFIIGSKGIPANYGGFETFVDELIQNVHNEEISFHVSCLSDNDSEFKYNGNRCFNVKVPRLGSAKAILYDLLSLKKSIEYIKSNNLSNSIIYILACRIGPFIFKYKRELKKLGVKLYVNPDGHEWKRRKWNYFVRKYWKFSEKLMVKNADLLICDSRKIEEYIKTEYRYYNPRTIYIPYGSSVKSSQVNNDVLYKWYKKFGIQKNRYYLVVGRFVPENNYEIIIREFLHSKTEKDLVIITNQETKFYHYLLKKTNFDKDKRIKFVGSVYDRELLKKIRENAFAYIHGHEVGGTNPSLLEALASTKINLLLDVPFNREVAENVAIYFAKEPGNLQRVIESTEHISTEEAEYLGKMAKARILNYYSWEKIAFKYEQLFLGKDL